MKKAEAFGLTENRELAGTLPVLRGGVSASKIVYLAHSNNLVVANLFAIR